MRTKTTLRLAVPTFVLFSSTLCAAPPQPGWAGAEDPPAGARERERRGGFAAKVYRGEAVVRVDDDNYVTIAVDEPDAWGAADGFADHVFSLVVLQPILEPLTLSDVVAEIELRPESVRVLLHTEEREIEFVQEGAPPRPRPQRSIYRVQVFEAAASLVAYAGPVVERFSMDEIQRHGVQGVPDLKTIIDPFHQSPDPDGDGNSCVASCSKTCVTGSCTASCVSGHCAKCKCLTGGTPSCYCV